MSRAELQRLFFFPSHTSTDTIPLQEAAGGVSVVVIRMLKAPSQDSFILLLIIQQLQKFSNPEQQKLEFCANTSSLLESPFKAAQYPSSAETANLMHTNADSGSF